MVLHHGSTATGRLERLRARARSLTFSRKHTAYRRPAKRVYVRETPESKRRKKEQRQAGISDIQKELAAARSTLTALVESLHVKYPSHSKLWWQTSIFHVSKIKKEWKIGQWQAYLSQEMSKVNDGECLP